MEKDFNYTKQGRIIFLPEGFLGSVRVPRFSEPMWVSTADQLLSARDGFQVDEYKLRSVGWILPDDNHAVTWEEVYDPVMGTKYYTHARFYRRIPRFPYPGSSCRYIEMHDYKDGYWAKSELERWLLDEGQSSLLR